MVMMYRIICGLIDISATSLLHPATLSTRGNSMRYLQPFCRTDAYRCSFFPSGIRLWNQLPVFRLSANLEDLQGRAARSLLDTTEECFYPFSNRFYQFLTTPQMHLVNIQCDNAPERALHLTGEEEKKITSYWRHYDPNFKGCRYPWSP